MKMNEIMRASEANVRTQRVIDETNHLPEIYETISKGIENAIKRGKFSANIMSKYEIPDYVLDKLHNQLGYKCKRMCLGEGMIEKSMIIEWW